MTLTANLHFSFYTSICSSKSNMNIAAPCRICPKWRPSYPAGKGEMTQPRHRKQVARRIV